MVQGGARNIRPHVSQQVATCEQCALKQGGGFGQGFHGGDNSALAVPAASLV
jgi:hypothetical protein